MHILVKLVRLHEGIEEWSDAFLSKLRVSHANKSIKLAIEYGVGHDHTKSPIWHDKLVFLAIRAAQHCLVVHEVTSDFSAAEADTNPVLILWHVRHAWFSKGS